MAEDHETVVVETAPSAAIAEMLVELLRESGIPAHVRGGFLQDEWSAAMRGAGLKFAEIEVPSSMADEARRVIAEARQSGALLDDFDEPPREDTTPPPP